MFYSISLLFINICFEAYSFSESHSVKSITLIQKLYFLDINLVRQKRFSETKGLKCPNMLIYTLKLGNFNRYCQPRGLRGRKQTATRVGREVQGLSNREGFPVTAWLSRVLHLAVGRRCDTMFVWPSVQFSLF